jgi:hypothetical protein
MAHPALRTLIVFLAVSLGCWDGYRAISNAASDSAVYEGDPRAFIGKKVGINLRGGASAPYGEAFPCVILRVEGDMIIVRALSMDKGGFPELYSKLVEMQKLVPVQQEENVFRIRRADVNRIWELTLENGA